jgi:hypothetical protein
VLRGENLSWSDAAGVESIASNTLDDSNPLQVPTGNLAMRWHLIFLYTSLKVLMLGYFPRAIALKRGKDAKFYEEPIWQQLVAKLASRHRFIILIFSKLIDRVSQIFDQRHGEQG